MVWLTSFRLWQLVSSDEGAVHQTKSREDQPIDDVQLRIESLSGTKGGLQFYCPIGNHVPTALMPIRFAKYDSGVDFILAFEELERDIEQATARRAEVIANRKAAAKKQCEHAEEMRKAFKANQAEKTRKMQEVQDEKFEAVSQNKERLQEKQEERLRDAEVKRVVVGLKGTTMRQKVAETPVVEHIEVQEL
ncbi:PREDICTED: uncharacterized protein LOC106814247 [Priapulus caudatus]|uniref:Uncharacterized protein LOC106814247 n=1 Tax=Priapulus caudatus TaxID=37621 RepID=A0ABM1EPA9_PRICU|nr:PREDICTED: uncharacterized protein LOC106814247 [Priapulus caudatus]